MFRTASRTALRRASSTQHQLQFQRGGRRLINTAKPAEKRRSWKGAAARWGLAGAAVYYYNTSSVFAEEPPLALEAASKTDDSSLPTIEAVAAARKRKSTPPPPPPQPSEPQPQQQQQPPSKPPPTPETTIAAPAAPAAAASEAEEPAPSDDQALQLPAEDLEQEAGQEGAFNPETGEINWDCPCLGGMAHGPCGEEFRNAFSCFVFSTEEPKGMDCIEKFKGMQDCFRLHPDIYGSELDEEQVDQELKEHISAEEAKTKRTASEAAEAASIEPPVAAPIEKSEEKPSNQ